MVIKWTRLSLEDRAAIFHTPDKMWAVDVDRDIEDVIEELMEEPYCGMPSFDDGLLEIPIHKDFTLIYRVQEQIQILRILRRS